jgi:hypothetical protein
MDGGCDGSGHDDSVRHDEHELVAIDAPNISQGFGLGIDRRDSATVTQLGTRDCALVLGNRYTAARGGRFIRFWPTAQRDGRRAGGTSRADQ